MRFFTVVVTLLLTVAVAHYIYIPLPDAIQEPWTLMLVDAAFRSIYQAALLCSWLGLGHSTQLLRVFLSSAEGLGVVLGGSALGSAGAGVRVSDTTFDGVQVRVYEPPPAGGDGPLRRAVLYFHGGGWALGSSKKGAYDDLTRMMSDELNAVVVSVEYRLYPEVHFPEPYLDCLSAAKHFLSPAVLSHYAVDPQRVAVSGDSAGGNLAAAVTQQISTDDSMSVRFSVQALIYPVLQALDFHTPSYQQNHNMAILQRSTMGKFWLQYLGAEQSLLPSLLANNHSALLRSALAPELRSRLDWSALLPPAHRKNYKPVVAETAWRGVPKGVPGLLDVRAAPLLAERGVLVKCPRAYVLTCEHDVLRDDGLMYARRLKDAGVTVTVDHYDNGFHGCLTIVGDFQVGRTAVRGYVNWLQKNL